MISRLNNYRPIDRSSVMIHLNRHITGIVDLRKFSTVAIVPILFIRVVLTIR